MLNVGVIGYGYWGPNLVRNFNDIDGAKVLAVSDLSPQRLAEARRRYPDLHTTTAAAELIEDSTLAAIAVATPVSSHYELALAALRAGKHVLVEKPFTATSAQATRLISEAAQRNLIAHIHVNWLAPVKVRRTLIGGSQKMIVYDDLEPSEKIKVYDRGIRVNDRPRSGTGL